MVMRGLPLSSPSSAATHLVALPQAPPSDPSGLRMRIKVAALDPGGAGYIRVSWQQPLACRGSASAEARVGVMQSGAPRQSSTTESLPHPCILTNGVSMAADIGPPCAARNPHL